MKLSSFSTGAGAISLISSFFYTITGSSFFSAGLFPLKKIEVIGYYYLSSLTFFAIHGGLNVALLCPITCTPPLPSSFLLKSYKLA
jgi:hypothetical protein